MRLNIYRARARVSVWLVFLVVAAFAAASPSLAADAGTGQPAARQSPDWLRDAVIYEVFPRVFSPQGNFKGVTAQLDRLKELGVSVLWLMPIHPLGKLKAKGTLGSPYAVRDYDAINPDYGTADDLKQLVDAAHRRDMKVFIDIVANHTAWDSVLIDQHPDWYRHDAAGHIVPPNPDWVDVAQLDYSAPALRQYMSGMLVRWLRDYRLDGFRCDYAIGVPRDFWEAVQLEFDRVRPGLAFMAEADDPALLVSAFDIDYAWDFYHAMSDALSGRVPASFVREVWERAEARYPRGALRLRFSDNHDQLRATGQFGLPAALAASAVMFTLDGVPLLYNGMEVGDTTESTAPALFERAPIAWEMAERRPQVTPYYQALTALRRAHPAFTRGAVRWLRNDDEQRVLSYERGGAGETLVVVVNLSSQNYAGIVEAAPGEYREITPATRAAAAGSATKETGRRPATLPAVFLAPWEFKVFSRASPTN
jgi:cyclomaltodextrinase / maltogenic alpha-amylase / neopullulanase